MTTDTTFAAEWKALRDLRNASGDGEFDYDDAAGRLLAAVPHVIDRVWDSDVIRKAGKDAIEAAEEPIPRRDGPDGEEESDDAFEARVGTEAVVRLILDATDAAAALSIVMKSSREHGAPRMSRNQWGSANPPPPREFLVDGWLAAGRIALFAGKGGKGKSRLSLQLAAAMAGENPDWLVGAPPVNKSNVDVVIATWEDEDAEVHRRLIGMERADDVSPRLHFLDFAGEGALWEPVKDGSRHTSTMGGEAPPGKWLRLYCEKYNARLLVIDPLAAAFASNENDRGLVRAFMSSWDAWARETGCAVLLVAHPAKDNESQWSGSTDWHAAARAVWTLRMQDTGTGEKREPAKALSFECVKQSYAMRPDNLWLTADPNAGPFRATTPEAAAQDTAARHDEEKRFNV